MKWKRIKSTNGSEKTDCLKIELLTLMCYLCDEKNPSVNKWEKKQIPKFIDRNVHGIAFIKLFSVNV